MLITIGSFIFSIFYCSKYYRQISFNLVFYKLTELHDFGMKLTQKTCERQILRKITPLPNFSQFGEPQFLGPHLPKNISWWSSET